MAESENSYSYRGLSEADVKKAKKELGENPDKVLAQIASLRRWLKSMRHLTCRTDDEFLLRFLRAAKFEQSRAQQLLDNFCTVRSSPRGCPEWFEPMPLDSPQMKAFMEMPFNVPLGYNDNGEAVIVSRMGGFDPDKMPFEDLVRCAYMLGDIMFSGEKETIHGIRAISDMQGASKKHFAVWQNPRTLFKMMRNWQDAFPIRMKAIIYFNEPSFFDIFFSLMQPMMKEKMKKRVQRCGADVARLKKAVGPGAERLLPKEMGGENGTIADLIAARNAKFLSEAAVKERQLLAGIRVDESMRQPDTKNYLKAFDDSTVPGKGISGTFTKLNVD